MATIPAEVANLILTYRTAQRKLAGIIATAQARGNVTAYRRSIMRQITQELEKLDKFAQKWAEGYIPGVYKSAADAVTAFYKAAEIAVPNVALNRRAIGLIVDNTVGLLQDANKHLGRIMDDAIRQAGVQATAEKLAAGDTMKQMKRNLEKKLLDQGMTSITYRNGRRVRIDAYAELVARSTTAETTNRATMQQMEDIGQDLVQMSSHRSPCPICAPLEGRVYSISGKDKRYPKLERAFGDTYANIHPNCMHRLTPYVEKFDDNATKTRRQSNQSFETDPRSKAEIEEYRRRQEQNSARRRDLRAYEEAKLIVPDQAPKTFAAFRSMKRNNSEAYRQLTHDVIYVKNTK